MFFLAGYLSASEMTVTLEEKISASSIVATGEVIAIKKGKIQEHPTFGMTQEIFIAFEIHELLKGRHQNRIEIQAASVSYAKEPVTTQTGPDSYTAKMSYMSASAGFSASGIKIGDHFIAYLKEDEDGIYRLAGHSNQYLEFINVGKNTVRDIGQGNRMVPLIEKLDTLRRISKALPEDPGHVVNGPPNSTVGK